MTGEFWFELIGFEGIPLASKVDIEIPTRLLQNRRRTTHLAKYYVPLKEFEKLKVEYKVHRLVVNRDPKFTNFVEVGAIIFTR
ncbi:hypothetical protein LguiA_015404 [Lonicera macranthoides]